MWEIAAPKEPNVRGFKRDREATKQAFERGQLVDPRSFLTLNGDYHGQQGGHWVLYGEDVKLVRESVYVRAQGRCEACPEREWVPWEVGHMDHERGGLTGRCWCMANLRWICAKSHKEKHVQVRLRSMPL